MSERDRALRALEIANHVRKRRAIIRRDIKTGRRSIDDVILNPPAELKGMRFILLIESQHGWGAQRSRKFCREVMINPVRTIGELSERQRETVANALAGRNGVVL